MVGCRCAVRNAADNNDAVASRLGLSRTMSHLQVVLLARDTPPNHPAAKELGLDLALWQPLIMDRQFVDWLVKHPSDQVHIPRSTLRQGFGGLSDIKGTSSTHLKLHVVKGCGPGALHRPTLQRT
jgi:RNA helicase (UPF2 interacting domain)